MVAPNSRLLNAFPLVRLTTVRGRVVPEGAIRSAAQRGGLSQLEAWLDFVENQPKGFPAHRDPLGPDDNSSA